MPATPLSPPAPVWVVIPAAGSGSRMGSDIPKQYLTVGGRTLLQITCEKMLRLPALSGVVVALNARDSRWSAVVERLGHPLRLHTVIGGGERADSVLNALRDLRERQVDDDHWVLVHDAARPCVTPASVERLRRHVEAAGTGGILAKPVADTLKNVEGERIQQTVDRSILWQAHTPQMFRLGDLFHALSAALQQGLPITDEASALEQQGMQPLVILDSRDNIKVTHPEDLPLATMILQAQLEQQETQ